MSSKRVIKKSERIVVEERPVRKFTRKVGYYMEKETKRCSKHKQDLRLVLLDEEESLWSDEER